MALSWLLLFTSGLFLAPPVPATTSQDFRYDLRLEDNLWTATVAWTGGVLLRLRSPDGERVQSVARDLRNRLEKLALQGVLPEDWAAVRREGRYLLEARGEVFLELSREWVQYSRSDPEALSRQWLQSLQAAFAAPYLTLPATSALDVPIQEWAGYTLGGRATGDCSAQVEPEGLAEVRCDAGGATLRLRGLQRGDGLVRIERQGAVLTWPVRVRPLAAGWRRRPMVEWAGNLPAPLRDRAWRQNLLAAADLQPGAVWKWIGETGSGSLALEVNAPDCLPARLRPDTTPRRRDWDVPATHALLISNSPENVVGDALLAWSALEGDRNSRWLIHHKNVGSRSLQLEMRVVNRSPEWRRIFYRPAFYGPNRDEIFTGHQAMRAYWDLLLAGAGYFLWLPPETSVALYEQPFRPGEIISGLGDLTPLDGPVELAVLTTSSPGAPSFYRLLLPQQRGSTTLFPQAGKSLEGEYNVGGHFLFFSVGREPVQADNGERLAGNYGVLYELNARLHNPGAASAPVAVVFSAAGGVARGVLWVDGKLVETGVVRGSEEVTVHHLTLRPREKRRLTVRVIPQAGSNYPLRIVVQPVL